MGEAINTRGPRGMDMYVQRGRLGPSLASPYSGAVLRFGWTVPIRGGPRGAKKCADGGPTKRSVETERILDDDRATNLDQWNAMSIQQFRDFSVGERGLTLEEQIALDFPHHLPVEDRADEHAGE